MSVSAILGIFAPFLRKDSVYFYNQFRRALPVARNSSDKRCDFFREFDRIAAGTAIREKSRRNNTVSLVPAYRIDRPVALTGETGNDVHLREIPVDRNREFFTPHENVSLL